MTLRHDPKDNAVFADVTKRLAQIDGLTEPDFQLLQTRFFSRIYAVQGKIGPNSAHYILKISTTSRSSEEEYGHYVHLNTLGIRTLVPVVCSGTLAYLVTRRETLTAFDRHLKKLALRDRCAEFYRLGELFSALDARTGESAAFDGDRFEKYVVPRIERLSSLVSNAKSESILHISSMARALHGSPGRNCFVSDFALGNIHVDEKGEIVLLDHGDATISDVNSNIAYLYLSIRFGPLNQYVDWRRNTEDYFQAYLQGYDKCKPDPERLLLYRAQHIVNMISFLEDRTPAVSLRPRRLASVLSDQYLIARYRNHLFSVIDAIQKTKRRPPAGNSAGNSTAHPSGDVDLSSQSNHH